MEELHQEGKKNCEGSKTKQDHLVVLIYCHLLHDCFTYVGFFYLRCIKKRIGETLYRLNFELHDCIK